MDFSRVFILRPVATVLFMAAIAITGGVAYRLLPVSALPQVEYPTIVVSTFYPGASPDVVASSITTPLERQLGQIPGLSQMTSSSTEGCSVITLRFVLELNIDVASQQVQAAINVASGYLPRDLPNPPIYNKTNPADSPVLTLALSSATLPLSRIQDLADTRLAQKLSQVAGVGQVTVTGGQKKAIRIQVNPLALANVGLDMTDIRAALVASNVNQAKGSFDGLQQSVIIAANDQLLTSQQYRDVILAQRDGAVIKVSDIANVIDDVENQRQAAWVNQTPAVLVNIQRQTNANVIDVVDRIKASLPQLKESLPASIDVKVVLDRTETIRASIHDVQFELLLTIALVVLVVFVFLRSLRATIIPGVAVPLSIVGSLGVMYLFGCSINNLTLMALTISAGFVVDDAIVMVENIIRYIEQGMTPKEAALAGAKEISFTIISLSVSLIAVLIPLLFMGDIIGRLFREFAITLSITIVISAVISLSLTPMMCSLLLSQREIMNDSDSLAEASKVNIFSKFIERLFGGFSKAYERTLQIILNHQIATMTVFFATMIATIYLYIIIPKGFFPPEDTGVLLGITEGPQDVSFPAMKELQEDLNRRILEDDDVESITSFIGIDGTNLTLNSGRIQVKLKPHEHREGSAVQIARRIQDYVNSQVASSLFLQPVQDLSVETRVSRSQFQFTFENSNSDELATWVPIFVEKLRSRPELRDVATDQLLNGSQVQLVVDRDSASRLGVDILSVDDVLYDAFGQRQVSTIFTQSNQYRVILEVAPEFRNSKDDLGELRVKTATGSLVPISSFAKTVFQRVPLAINHQSQFPVVTVSFNLRKGFSLDSAIRAVSETLAETDMPASMISGFQGTAQAFQKSLTTTPLLILAALVTVYIVLGVLYESYVHPITILSTLPSAGVGALLALMWCGLELTVISLIGIILLIGIVKKNAIMMIDFALDAQRNQGMHPRDAIYQACLLRFRPIMMTTMAALLGAVPLAMSSGVGAELRQPLGITIIGGLVLSQVLTLYTTPVIYLWLDQLRHFAGKRTEGEVDRP
jgi:multidrug efflux pump